VVKSTQGSQAVSGATFSVSTVLAMLQEILRQRRQLSRQVPEGRHHSAHRAMPGHAGPARLSRGLLRRVLWRGQR
jgi:hypothetical protein